MIVTLPATPGGLHARVLPAILAGGHVAVVAPMLEVESYYRLLLELWRRPADLAIVEHDIEVLPGQLEELEACPRWWCAYSYEVYAGDVAEAYGAPYALGCTRFRRELLEAHPDAVQRAGELDLHPVHPPRSYAVMDSTLTQILRGYVESPHQHRPNVVHHHEYNRAGAYVPQPR